MKPFALLLLILSSSALPSNAAFIQWTLGSGGNGHWYGLTPTPYSWTDAEAFSVASGGHLASIGSIEEQAFIEAAFLSGANSRMVAWIGFNDAAVEGDYVWSSGEPVTFTHWTPGEPSAHYDEHFVAINWHYNHDPSRFEFGRWNNLPNDTGPSFGEYYFGIFELNALPSAVPEPESLLIPSIAFFSAIAFRRRTDRFDRCRSVNKTEPVADGS